MQTTDKCMNKNEIKCSVWCVRDFLLSFVVVVVVT